MIQKIQKGKKYFLVVPGHLGTNECELWVNDICSKLGIVSVGYYFNKSVNQMQFIEVEE